MGSVCQGSGSCCTLRPLADVPVWQALTTVTAAPGSTERGADMRTNATESQPRTTRQGGVEGTHSPGPSQEGEPASSWKTNQVVSMSPHPHPSHPPRHRGRDPHHHLWEVCPWLPAPFCWEMVPTGRCRAGTPSTGVLTWQPISETCLCKWRGNLSAAF